MKTNVLTILILTSLSVNGLANNNAPTNTPYSDGNAYHCLKLADAPIPENKIDDERNKCQAVSQTAQLAGANLRVNPEEKATLDKRVICKRKAGYTLDYESCTKAAQVYDWIRVAEQGMTMQEQIRTKNNTARINEKVAKSAAQGNVQGASIDAVIENNKHLKQMNQERAAAYTAAVAALGSAIASWQGSSDKDIAKLCEGKKVTGNEQIGVPAESCIKAVKTTTDHMGINTVFANRDAKAGFIMALTEFIAQGIKAGIAASQFDTTADKLEKAKQDYTEPDQIVLEKCALAPMDPACIKPGERVSGQKYEGASFSMGSGNNNSFGGDGTDSEFGEPGDLTDIKDNETVASVNSPFMDEAKAANDILDPAGAASAPSGGGAAGGGGGGGGAPGGGSASLGDDLQGVDDSPNKEAELKAKKVAGSYKSAGAKGFSGIRGSKEDANPFASLFDAKTEGGGIEERSIASGDIDGKASGLFQKISKRYSLIQAEKRIEANNLE